MNTNLEEYNLLHTLNVEDDNLEQCYPKLWILEGIYT